ncbi:hypothetical protein EC844_102123 [Acinetobacter calcoaceticus]|uniref:Uncharacterized protein n=1 Tax=Acinetobacter calcoaceticus TaxID=471 RepID=A0A4R1Y052_ACICA|nr:hypothetical protein EC844_102123 [Acinetobacter calcoaceticus]
MLKPLLIAVILVSLVALGFLIFLSVKLLRQSQQQLAKERQQHPAQKQRHPALDKSATPRNRAKTKK